MFGVKFTHADASLIGWEAIFTCQRSADEPERSWRVISSMQGVSMAEIPESGDVPSSNDMQVVTRKQVVDVLPVIEKWTWQTLLCAVHGISEGHRMGRKGEERRSAQKIANLRQEVSELRRLLPDPTP